MFVVVGGGFPVRLSYWFIGDAENGKHVICMHRSPKPRRISYQSSTAHACWEIPISLGDKVFVAQDRAAPTGLR